MSAESKASMREAWTRWQGQVLNGTFPLHRYLGGSDHSGVFLTEHPARQLSEVAVKLVPAIPTLAESQLSQWDTTAALNHPHLVRIYESGQCRLGGLPYLYAVMEYSDQNLGQLLLTRALTEEEARDMLLPILNALQFLHDRELVHGRLKPANILVVGDQLKLASDTICGVGDATASINMASVYDPPEARDGSRSTASDIWALGVSLYEAFTRDPPTGIEEPGVNLVLPHGFPAGFRELVTRCLSRRPADRPRVKEIEAWSLLQTPLAGAPPQDCPPVDAANGAAGQPLAAAQRVAAPGPIAAAAPASPAAAPKPVPPVVGTAAPKPIPAVVGTAGPQSAAPVPGAAAPKPLASVPGAARAQPAVAAASPPAAVARAPRSASAAERRRADDQPSEPRSFIPLVVGVVVVIGLVWFGLHALRSHPTSPSITAAAPPPGPAAAPAAASAPAPGSQPATNSAPVTPPVSSTRAPTTTRAPVAAARAPASTTRAPVNTARSLANTTAKRAPSSVTPSATVHEELPDVPRSARRTIHGHVRVSVRLMVNKDGAVFASLVDNRGPSRYFERLAIDAAKKWRFTAVDAPDRRLELVRFEFTREGTTAHAVEVH